MIKVKKKWLSLLMTLAMITTLFVGLTINVSAATDVWDGSVATGFASGDGSDGNPYIIKTGAQLAYLATQVNSGNSYSGSYFKLDDDINLNGSSSGNAWAPIGGQIHENSSYVPIPATNYFAGNFEGNNCTIEGLYINTSVTTGSSGNFAGWGLFGCASGPVKNLTVKGSITLSGSAEYVGGIVGYTTSDVYNCHTEVTISATSASNVGGVVGAIERTETSALTSPFKVQACSAKNNISAGKRVGGVVGGVYCKYAGNVRVDNCYFASGTSTPVTFTVNSGKAWSGSVVGYNKGYISNCYAVATLISGGGRYICGIAGVLNGSSPQAKLENSYAAVNFSGCSTSYDRPLFGSCDYSNTLEINYCLYDSTLAGSYINPPGNGSNGWGRWTSSGYVTTLNLQSTTGTATVFTSPSTTGSSASVSTVLGSAFTVGSNNYNNNYPYLKWQASVSNLPDYTPGSTTTSTLPSTVYVDGVSGDNNNSGATSTSAFKTLDKAINNVASAGTIYVVDTVTLNGTYNFTPTLNIKRDGNGNFPLFEIADGTVKFSTMTVSGEGHGTLFSVTGGTLYLRGGITLNNCDTAVDVAAGGALVLNSSNITGTNYSVKLAAASGSTPPATCEMSVITSTGQELTINGTAYLASGTYIEVASSPALMFPNVLNIEYADPADARALVKGNGYTLTSADAAKVNYVDTDYDVTLDSTNNELELLLGVYLDGTAVSAGSGTKTSPYNDLTTAVTAASASGRTVLVSGTVSISADTTLSYVFRRASGYTGTLFSVADGKVLTLASGASISGDPSYVDVYLTNSLNVDNNPVDGALLYLSNVSNSVIRIQVAYPDDEIAVAVIDSNLGLDTCIGQLEYVGAGYNFGGSGLNIWLVNNNV